MKIIKFIVSTSFLSGAFIAGVAFAKLAQNKNIVEKIKKMTIKKNLSASTNNNNNDNNSQRN